jgi:hypothetical protein
MKTLLSLLLIISITVISWSAFAKNTVIQVNTLYIQSSSTSNSLALKSYLPTLIINENTDLMSNKANYKKNDFFEMTIFFNEKLQQVIASLKSSHNRVKEIAKNNITSLKNGMIDDCEEASS